MEGKLLFGVASKSFEISSEEFRERLEGKVLEKGKGFSSGESWEDKSSSAVIRLEASQKARLKNIFTRFGKEGGLHSRDLVLCFPFNILGLYGSKNVSVYKIQAVSKVMDCSCMEIFQP